MGIQCALSHKTVVAFSTMEFGGLSLRAVAGNHVVFFQVVLVGKSCAACFADKFRGVKTRFYVVRDRLLFGKGSVAWGAGEREHCRITIEGRG